MGKINDFLKNNVRGIAATAVMGSIFYGLTSLCVGVADDLAGPIATYHSEGEVGYVDPYLGKGPAKTFQYLTKNHSYVMKPFTLVWKAFGMVDYDGRKRMWNNILDNEGINGDDSEDNGARYRLYRKLGLAVREGKDESIYISVDKMKLYLSDGRTDEYDWGSMGNGFIGEVYFKMDSKEQGGDEDGVVESDEWKRALGVMGYRTKEKYIDDFVANFDEGWQQETARKVFEKQLEENPNYLDGIVGPDNLSSVPVVKMDWYLDFNLEEK